MENENLKWIKNKQIGSNLAKVRPEATFAEIELNNISWEPNLIFKLSERSERSERSDYLRKF